jgi:16S rRNA (guanine527-N7)-methyltransferase
MIGDRPFPPALCSAKPSINRVLGWLALPASQDQVTLLTRYVDELARWNKKVNLSGMDKEEDIVQNLIADALFLHKVIPPGKSILDLGSGSGILAVTLSILDVDRQVFSIDKSLRKIQFQRHVKRLLELANLELFHGRAQDLVPLSSNVLVAKAVGTVRFVLALGGRHLCEGGLAFLVRGASEDAPEDAGFVLEQNRPYELEKGGKTYKLLVYKKVP